MNRLELLLTMLSESSCKLSQEANTSSRLGLDVKTTHMSNANKMQTKYNELLALIELINEEENKTFIYPDSCAISTNKELVEVKLRTCKNLGKLTE